MLKYNIDFKMEFPLLIFKNNEEQICRGFIKSRGIYLYRQVYSALSKWDANVTEITYKQFSSLIRYDKSIRDKLYIYLAAAEEYLRNILFSELEIDRFPNDTTNEKFTPKDLRRKAINENDSNLYYFSYSKYFDFTFIVHTFSKFKLAKKYSLTQSDLSRVRILRNKVMHHNMLLLSCFTERSDIEKNIDEIESDIEALYRVLPTNEFREGSEKDGKIYGGLTQAINKSNYPYGDTAQEPYNKDICLHKFVNGIFIK